MGQGQLCSWPGSTWRMLLPVHLVPWPRVPSLIGCSQCTSSLWDQVQASSPSGHHLALALSSDRVTISSKRDSWPPESWVPPGSTSCWVPCSRLSSIFIALSCLDMTWGFQSPYLLLWPWLLPPWSDLPAGIGLLLCSLSLAVKETPEHLCQASRPPQDRLWVGSQHHYAPQPRLNTRLSFGQHLPKGQPPGPACEPLLQHTGTIWLLHKSWTP